MARDLPDVCVSVWTKERGEEDERDVTINKLQMAQNGSVRRATEGDKTMLVIMFRKRNRPCGVQ